MTTGTEYAHYLTGTMTRRCEQLHREMPGLVTDLDHEDGERLHIHHGDSIRVSSRCGILVSKMQSTDRVTSGMIFMPLHLEEAMANHLTSAALDPVSKTPEYKVGAVKLEKVGCRGKAPVRARTGLAGQGEARLSEAAVREFPLVISCGSEKSFKSAGSTLKDYGSSRISVIHGSRSEY